MLAIAGAKAPNDTDGISFVPTLLSQPEQQKKHDYLFWDFAGYGGQLAVRMGKWKGIKRDLRKKPDATLELYDLENDVSEKNNIAKEEDLRFTDIIQFTYTKLATFPSRIIS